MIWSGRCKLIQITHERSYEEIRVRSESDWHDLKALFVHGFGIVLKYALASPRCLYKRSTSGDVPELIPPMIKSAGGKNSRDACYFRLWGWFLYLSDRWNATDDWSKSPLCHPRAQLCRKHMSMPL